MNNKYVKISISVTVALLIYYITRVFCKSFVTSLLIGVLPLIIALALAYLLYQLIKPIELVLLNVGVKNAKVKRLLSISITYIFIIAIITLALYFSIPALIDNIGAILSDVPNLQNKASEVLNDIKEAVPFLNGMDIDSIVGDLTNNITSLLPALYATLSSMIAEIGKIILLGSIVLIISTIMLTQKEPLMKDIYTFTTHLLGDNVANKISRGLHSMDVVMGGYFIGKLIECSIVTIVAIISYLLIGVPYAVFFAILLGLLYLIPYIGGYLALIPTVVILLMYSPQVALLTTIAGFININIVGILISPLILQDKLNIHPITVIVSVLVGGELCGILGYILAPPVAGIIALWLKTVSNRRKKPVPHHQSIPFSPVETGKELMVIEENDFTKKSLD